MTRKRAVAVFVVTLGILIMAGASGAEQTGQTTTASGTDDAVKALNAQRDLVKAQSDLVTAQKGLIDAMFPAFASNFGKSGEVKIDTGEGDKFHATAKAADALRSAASEVCKAVALRVPSETAQTDTAAGDGKAPRKKTIALFTDDDRRALAAYRVANGDGLFLKAQLEAVVAKKSGGSVVTEAVPPGLAIFGAGMLLSEIADFTKLFRTDRTLFFSAPDLPEQLLVDLIAACPDLAVSFPAAGVDAAFASGDSEFMKLVDALRALRQKIAANSDNKDLIDHYEQFMTKLLALDDAKFPVLFSVLRGEAAMRSATTAEKRILTVRLVTKGGTTMKTSNIWREDRFYASGGVIVSYRYTVSDTLVAADVIALDSGFSRLSLDTP